MNAPRGRPPVMPTDVTDFDGSAIDGASRLAWLLRSCRVRHPDRELRAQAAFAKRLASRGLRVDSARVSVWESGRASLPGSVLVAYARELGLPSGSLRAAQSALGRLTPAAPPRPGPGPQDAVAVRRRLDAVYERLQDAPTGGTWLDLAELVSGAAPVILPTRLVEDFVLRLLGETMRAVGPAYTTRVDALVRLAHTPSLAPVVTRGVETVSLARGAQGVADLVAVLGEVDDQVVIRRLIGHLAGEARGVRIGAAHALLTSIARGTFPAAEWAGLEDVLRSVAAAEPAGTGALIRRLLGSRLSPNARTRVGLPAEQTPAPGPAPSGVAGRHGCRHLDAWREARAQFEHTSLEHGLPADPMYLRLVREALFSRFPERRRHAALLLMHSPHRDPAALGALRLATQDARPVFRDGALTLLTYLVTPGTAGSVLPLLDRADLAGRRAALLALAHARAVLPEVDLVAMAGRDPALAPTVAYAAGMVGHPALRSWADDPHAPTSLRSRAAWWLEAGSAVAV